MENLTRLLLGKLLKNHSPEIAQGSAARPLCLAEIMVRAANAVAPLPAIEKIESDLQRKRIYTTELCYKLCQKFWTHDWYAGPGFYHFRDSNTVGPFDTELEAMTDAWLIYCA